MTWVRLLTADDVDGPAREAAESGIAQYGQLLNTWGALLNRPEIFAAYLPFLRAVAGPGELDARTKDLSALLVGSLNGCRYTVSHRAASAARNGVPVGDVRATVTGDWDSFDPALRAALRFTRELTVLPPSIAYADAAQCVDAAILDELSSLFTDAQLVELAMSVSVWNALSRFHRVMGFELDMPAPPEGTDPASAAGDPTA